MQTDVARTETKYALDEVTAARLRSVLDMVMHRDAMGDWDGYMVRSLYFDTWTDSDYHDKMEGLDERQKVRLRIYSPDDQTAKLELKRKVGKYQWKRTISVSREDAYLLMAGRYAEVQEKMTNPQAKKLVSMMERQGYIPAGLVEFRRLAFVAPIENTRITFDTSLRASQLDLDLYAPDPAYYPILHPVILEVKYTNILASHIKTALRLADQMPVSVSKYCLGRQINFL